MRIIVQKYGGSSLADTDKIKEVARHVTALRQQGFDVVVVVSAMGKTTDNLIDMARQINPSPARREMDMLVTVGERVSMALLSMAIQGLGFPAVSLTGSQAGIITNASHTHARIIEIRPFRVLDSLEDGKIVIIAGYQGMSYNREITSLGRGGSDTTAVAMAAALDAERCEIYSDIDGVYSADPRVVLSAHRLEEIDYTRMIALARHGAVVLNADAVEFARRKGIAIYARASFGHKGRGTVIRRGQPTADRVVSGVTSKAVCVVRWKDVVSLTGLASFMMDNGAGIEYLGHDPAGRGMVVLDTACLAINEAEFMKGLDKWLVEPDITRDLAMVTVVGEGVSRPGIYNCFVQKAGPESMILATPITLSALVRRANADACLRAVHDVCVEAVPGEVADKHPKNEKKLRKSEKK